MLEIILIIVFIWFVGGTLSGMSTMMDMRDDIPSAAKAIYVFYCFIAFPVHFLVGIYSGSKFWIDFFLEKAREKKQQELQEKDAALRLLDKEAKLSLKEGVHR